MTDDEARALGERAVACVRFRWLPGMLPFGCMLERCAEAPPESHLLLFWADEPHEQGQPWWPEEWGGKHPPVPDLRDPATRGAVLELVREAWGGPVSVTSGGPASEVLIWPHADAHAPEHVFGCGELAACLVAALESAL